MTRLRLQVVLILLIPVLPAGIVAVTVFPLSDAKASLLAEGELTLDEALALEPLWIDARSAEEHAAGHIPGALLLNEDDWDKGFAALLDAWDFEQPLVIYCSSQTCDASHAVAERLKNHLRFDQIYVLQGGWETWQSR